MTGQFERNRSNNFQYYFNLKAGNGEVILTRETYTAKVSAQIGIASVRINAPADGNYERKKTLSNQWYFVLRAGNFEILGRSEMYNSSIAMENGIESVKANAPTAEVVDLT